MRVLALLLLPLLACTPKPKPMPMIGEDGGIEVCAVVLPTECSDAGLRYGDVKPTIDAHCVNCHWGQVGGPWPLRTYEDVTDWAPEVRDSIGDCSMPQADGGTHMTTAEKQRVLDWLRCDHPR